MPHQKNKKETIREIKLVIYVSIPPRTCLLVWQRMCSLARPGMC